MIVRYSLVADERAVGHLARLHEGFQAVFEPALHPLPDREIIGVEGKPALPVGERPGQLRCHLLAGLAVECLPLTSLGSVHSVLSYPSAVLTPRDGALTVTALLGHLLLLSLH